MQSFTPLLFSFFLSTTFLTCIAQSRLIFERLGMEDGLADVRVEQIYQDAKGFMWFGTEAGLNRYDGLRMRTYAYDPDHPERAFPSAVYEIVEDRQGSMWVLGLINEGLFLYHPEQDTFQRFLYPTDLRITAIYPDSQGNLWIGTMNGLLAFDPAAGSLRTFYEVTGHELAPAQVSEISEDSFGNLWFGYPNGLYQFSRQDDSLNYYPLREDEARVFYDEMVTAPLFEDSRRRLWVGTRNGLYFFDRNRKMLVPYPLTDQEQNRPLSINCIAESKEGTLWIGKQDSGLYLLDLASGKLRHLEAQPNEANALPSNNLYTIYRDQQDNMWIGTLDAGIALWSDNRKAFSVYQHDPDVSTSIRVNGATGFYERPDGHIWMSVGGSTLELFKPDQETFNHDFSHVFSYRVVEDNRQQVWASSWGWGLSRLDLTTGQVVTYRHIPSEPGSLPGDAATLVRIDGNGELWVGVWGEGLFRYDLSSGQFIPKPLLHPASQDTIGKYIYHVLEDRKGNTWIGAIFELIQLNPNGEVEQVYDLPTHMTHEDADGQLWLATRKGLCRLNPSNGDIRCWTSQSGLPHHFVYSILEEEDQALWLGTHQGLSRFDLKTKTFRNYNHLDGLPGDRFWRGAALKSRSGDFYFGTSEGVLRFRPDQIQNNPNIPPVVITDFRIANRSVPIRGNSSDTLTAQSPLLRQAPYAERIELNWQQNDLAFEFAALNYLHPFKNHYRYRLENYDTDWISTDAERPYANYTNLNPGEYTFRVIGSNNDGVWNEAGASVLLIIRPPWWQTTWAMLIYVVIGLGILYYMHHLELRKQNRKLAAEREKLAHQQRVNAMASRFVPNAFIHTLGKDGILDVQLGDSVAKEVTVMFSDIRDYTTLSETMTPEENFAFVNAFNRRMGPIIRQHHGFINQYLGDSIMSLFKTNPVDGLRAAVDMQRQLQQYNEERKAKNGDRRAIQVGIGLHTGPLIMGIIGDEERMDAATISDTVNTAARLESMTKHYQVRILLSEESKIAGQLDLSDEFQLRFLGKVQLKGKKEPIGIHECFDSDPLPILEKKLDTYPLFSEGVEAYFARRFKKAAAAFEQVLAIYPEDHPAQLFLAKATRYLQEGAPDDWSGVEVMGFK